MAVLINESNETLAFAKSMWLPVLHHNGRFSEICRDGNPQLESPVLEQPRSERRTMTALSPEEAPRGM